MQTQPISFQGKVIVTTFNRLEREMQTFNTNKVIDAKIRQFVEDLSEKRSRTILEKTEAGKLHELFEQAIGRNIRKVRAEKVLYNGGDNIIFADRDAKLLDGVHVDMYL